MQEVTRILRQFDGQDGQHASDLLLPIIYDELRRLAAIKLQQERPGHSLQATALVHEAFVRLVDGEEQQKWKNRNHFYAAAAEAMRRILIESARQRLTEKRGGKIARSDMRLDEIPSKMDGEFLIELNDAIEELHSIDPQKAHLVDLRYFCGMTLEEVAEVMGISRASASRYWTFTKAWLYDRLRND